MAITTILFDMDGTLLPMDQEVFTKQYFKLLAKKMAPHNYKPEELIDGVWKGTSAMIKNNGSMSNEDAFWSKFSEIYGQKAYDDKCIFDEFYRNEFTGVKDVCGHNEKVSELINNLKKEGYRLVLATNPIFPQIATENRISWTGLSCDDFELCTSYENMSYSKPNPKYYLEITEKIGVKPEECLMVGNDVSDDMVAELIGMKVFLLSDCLINKENKDISAYPSGNFETLEKYIKENH